jgi:hypothetical protein
MGVTAVSVTRVSEHELSVTVIVSATAAPGEPR